MPIKNAAELEEAKKRYKILATRRGKVAVLVDAFIAIIGMFLIFIICIPCTIKYDKMFEYYKVLKT